MAVDQRHQDRRLARETHEFIDHQFALVGDFMANRPDGPTWDVYPQGSVRLGTVVQPIACEGTLDVDMVCERDVMKESTTQKKLMAEVGDALKDYIADSTHRTRRPSASRSAGRGSSPTRSIFTWTSCR